MCICAHGRKERLFHFNVNEFTTYCTFFYEKTLGKNTNTFREKTRRILSNENVEPKLIQKKTTLNWVYKGSTSSKVK